MPNIMYKKWHIFWDALYTIIVGISGKLFQVGEHYYQWRSKWRKWGHTPLGIVLGCALTLNTLCS